MSEENLDNPEISDEDIERATRQGWSPKEEWKGPEEQWVDAKTFLKRGDEILPIVRANNKKLEQELNELKMAREEDKKTFEEFKKFAEEARKREEADFKKQLAEIKSRKAEAVKEGDSQAFTQAEQEEEQLREEHQAKKEEAKEVKPSEHPDFKPWLKENQWYETSRVAKALANEIGAELSRTSTKTGKAFYDEVAAEVRKEMPELFENPIRGKAPAVEGASGGKPKAKGKTYSDLPVEAKRACDDFCKTIPGFTKEQYLKDFDWSSYETA